MSDGKQPAGFVDTMQTQNASRVESPTTSDNIELIRFLPHLDISWNWEADDKGDANKNNGIYSVVNQTRSTRSQENVYESLAQYENIAFSLQSLRLNSASLGRAVMIRGNLEEIREIVLDKNFKVNALDDQGLAPLHHAARENNLDAVKMLLDNGAKVDTRDKFGSTPLHTAAR